MRIFSKKKKMGLIPQVGRWWLQVQEFTFEIKYKLRSRMPRVDALSDFPVTVDINKIDITEGNWILSVQLQNDKWTTVRKIFRDEAVFPVKNPKVYRKSAGENGKYPLLWDGK